MDRDVWRDCRILIKKGKTFSEMRGKRLDDLWECELRVSMSVYEYFIIYAFNINASESLAMRME